MNLSYTGLHRVLERLLVDLDDLRAARLDRRRADFASFSSHSLRMYGTDSFAASRKIFCSSGVSVSQTFFDISSISGAIECSVFA